MIKSIASSVLVMFFIFSFCSLAFASLNTEGQSNLAADSAKPQLYCGLALPPDGEGDETDGTEDEAQGGSESEPDS